MNNKNVVLFMTHFINENILTNFNQLAAELPSDYDIFVLYDNTTESFDVSRYSESFKYYLFKEENIKNFHFPVKNYIHPGKIFPMDVDYVFLDFYYNYPEYKYYWVLEYDVAYSGHWKDFFNEFSSSASDLLATNIHRHAVFPEWPMWKTLRTPDAVQVSKEHWIRAFFPLSRFSNRALRIIDDAYKQGWAGHYEVAVGTLLHHEGLKIEDFGGQGEFVKPGNEDKHYTSTINNKFLSPGSFVYRPIRHSVGKQRNLLWHPVKERNILGFLRNIMTPMYWKKRYWDWCAARRIKT